MFGFKSFEILVKLIQKSWNLSKDRCLERVPEPCARIPGDLTLDFTPCYSLIT